MSNTIKGNIRLHQLAKRVVEKLKDENIKKTVLGSKHKFYITDGNGNSKAFTINPGSQSANYTIEDVERILELYHAVIEQCIQNGEEIYVHNKYTIGVVWRNPRLVTTPGFDEKFHVSGYYAPKFQFGIDAKRAAKIYQESIEGIDESYDNDPENSYDILIDTMFGTNNHE